MARLETTALPSARLPFEQFRTGASTQYTLDAPAPADVVDLVRRRRLEAAVRRLPPFPADLHQLLREMASEDADFRKLEERIAADPALATRVLRMANSAFYSQRDKVCSIARALLVVGLRTARNLILAASLRGALRRPVWLPGFSGSGFLRHSLASAVCCHRLGVVLPGLRAYGEGLFLAGLLHDIGMVALEEFYREAFAMIETANQPVAPDLERRILGLDHLEAGALVARVWDLPGPWRDIIALPRS
jgi:HD-like signal output (HDOD) protein